MSDPWGEDFNDADVEECMFLASQMCPAMDSEASAGTSTTKQDEATADDLLFNDLGGGGSHSVLTSSQPIPSTQPRQYYDRLALSNAKYGNTRVNSISSNGDRTEHGSILPAQSRRRINARTSTDDTPTRVDNHNASQIITSIPKRLEISSTVTNKPESSLTISNMDPPPPRSLNSAIRIQNNQNRKNPTNEFKKPLLPPLSSTKSFSTHTSVANTKILSAPSPYIRPRFNSSQQQPQDESVDENYLQEPGVIDGNKRKEEELMNQLMQSQMGMGKLEKDILTKQGEVSYLRSELQRKTLALDTERLARSAALVQANKDTADKVVAAGREATSKTKALERRLDRMQADMAFKNREIVELITKCKKMEEHQQRQQQEGQQLNGTVIVTSPVKAAVAAVATKKFPSNRFDFSDKESPATAVKKKEDEVGEMGQRTEARQNETDERKVEAVEELTVKQLSDHMRGSSVPKDLLRGSFSISKHCLGLLSSLGSNTLRYTAAVHEQQRLLSSSDARQSKKDRLVAELRSGYRHVNYTEQFEFIHAWPTNTNELDELYEGEDDDDGGDWGDCSKRGSDVKKGKNEVDNIKKVAAEEDCMDSTNAAVQIGGIHDLYSKAAQHCKQLDMWHASGELKEKRKELDEGAFKWTDEQVAKNNFKNKNTNDTAADKQIMPNYGIGMNNLCDKNINNNRQSARMITNNMERTNNDRQQMGMITNGINAEHDAAKMISGVATTDATLLPRPWLRLLAVMAQDSTVYKYEYLAQEDHSDPKNNFENADFVNSDDDECLDYQGLETVQNRRFDCQPGDTLQQRRHAQVRTRLGDFLYSFTEEALTAGGAAAKAKNTNRDEEVVSKGLEEESTGKKTNKAGLGNLNRGAASEVSAMEGIEEGQRTPQLSDIYLECVVSRKDINLRNAARELFLLVLEWLSEEATRYNEMAKDSSNLGKDLTRLTKKPTHVSNDYTTLCKDKITTSKAKQIISGDEKERSQVQRTALIILEHLLPLKFSRQHLPPPLVVVAHLLCPPNLQHVQIPPPEPTLAALTAAARHGCAAAVLSSPEACALLLARLSAHCHAHVQRADQLQALLECLLALQQQHNSSSGEDVGGNTFTHSLCSVTDECLAWQVCVCVLDICCEPFTALNSPANKFPSGKKPQPPTKNTCAPRASRSSLQASSNSARTESLHWQDSRKTTWNDSSNPTSIGTESPNWTACMRLFVRWVSEVLLAQPPWLYSDCGCPTLLLGSLLAATHLQACMLVDALPIVNRVKRDFCCLHKPSTVNAIADVTDGNANDTNAPKELHNSSNSTTLPSNTTSNITLSTSRSATSLQPPGKPPRKPWTAECLCEQPSRTNSLSCSSCGTLTTCMGHCSCGSGLCGDHRDDDDDLNTRWRLVWSAVRVIKLYVDADAGARDRLANLPHYPLLLSLLTALQPHCPPAAADGLTSKILATL